MSDILGAFALVLHFDVIGVIIVASALGLILGATPGLTATMGTALLVPLTIFLDPVPAIGAIVALSAMAIFSGDIPGALLRIPGTPASAAYVEDTYKLAQRGEARQVLAISMLASVFGGIVGTIALVFVAPTLAEFALNFSSVEYFWLACLGLTAAAIVSVGSAVKGAISLLLGLFIATIGIDIVAGHPRFTFGVTELAGGVDFIPVLIGLFAFSELLRLQVNAAGAAPVRVAGTLWRGVAGSVFRFRFNIARGTGVGLLIGALPGASADMAAWIAYAVSKKFSKEPNKYGTGHLEGVCEATASNNASLSGAWIPTLVFGIPGDTITAIVIGVLYMKGMNPGPTIFMDQAQLLYAVFLCFFIANILLIPLGALVIFIAPYILRISKSILVPIILVACVVGSFASNNTTFGIGVMFVMGMFGFILEKNGFALAPLILGLILGPMVEFNFITSLIKSNGDFMIFFNRPVGGVLGVVTICVCIWPLASKIYSLVKRQNVEIM